MDSFRNTETTTGRLTAGPRTSIYDPLGDFVQRAGCPSMGELPLEGIHLARTRNRRRSRPRQPNSIIIVSELLDPNRPAAAYRAIPRRSQTTEQRIASEKLPPARMTDTGGLFRGRGTESAEIAKWNGRHQSNPMYQEHQMRITPNKPKTMITPSTVTLTFMVRRQPEQ